MSISPTPIGRLQSCLLHEGGCLCRVRTVIPALNAQAQVHQQALLWQLDEGPEFAWRGQIGDQGELPPHTRFSAPARTCGEVNSPEQGSQVLRSEEMRQVTFLQSTVWIPQELLLITQNPHSSPELMNLKLQSW